jgi:hypothetical protein
LLGVASLWISVKFDEWKTLKVQRIVDLCRETCSKKQVVEMEKRVLSIINFDLFKFIWFVYRTTWDMCTTFLVRFYLFFTFIQNSELNDNVKIIIVHQLFWWRLLFEFFVCMLGETKKNTWPWSCHWFKGFCCQIKKLMLNKKTNVGHEITWKIEKLKIRFRLRRFGRKF